MRTIPPILAGLLAIVAVAASANATTPKTVTVNYPVTGCAGTIQGVTPFPKPPRSAQFRVPVNLRNVLTAYGGQYERFPGIFILAPKGWKCLGSGGSGGISVQVSNPHGGFHDTSNGRQPNQTVTLSESGTSPNHIYGDYACEYFPKAAELMPRLVGYRCSTQERPIGEQSTLAARWKYSYFDPPHVLGTATGSGGPNPSWGDVLFDAGNVRNGAGSRASRLSCTLPAHEDATCSAILDEYVTRWRRR